jgi:peptidoglycan/LPS O-acetylase OafA/YrhL
VPRVVAFDGIRAIAVTEVFLFHALGSPDLVEGRSSLAICRLGYLGVEAFFVLSGFLITLRLLSLELQPELTAADRWRQFSLRRIARIAPPYYATLVGLALFGETLHLRQVDATAWPAFVVYAANLSSFFTQSWQGPGHLWSVCVEEQFYLLMAAIFFTRARSLLVPVTVAAVLATTVLWIGHAAGGGLGPWGFALPILHFDALGAGVLAALVVNGRTEEGWTARKFGIPFDTWLNAIAAVAWASFLVAALSIERCPLVEPALHGFLSVAVAATVVALWRGRWRLATVVLGCRPLRALGTVSYGFYLFHVFIVEYLWHVDSPLLPRAGVYRAVLAYALTCVAATISWRWFERPILRIAHGAEPVSTRIDTSSTPAARGTYRGTFAVLLVLAVLASLGPTCDGDTYWHLATGRAALRMWSLLPNDVFSFSFAGARGAYKTLAVDVLLYIGFVRWGYAWLAALKFGAMTAVAYGAYAFVPPRERRRIGVLAAGFMILALNLTDWPALLSLGLFALDLVLVERARRLFEHPGASSVSALAPLVAVNMLWTWVDRSCVVGHGLLLGLAVLLAGAFAGRGSRILRGLFGSVPSPGPAVAASIAALIGLLLSLLNPSGTAAITAGLWQAGVAKGSEWDATRAGAIASLVGQGLLVFAALGFAGSAVSRVLASRGREAAGGLGSFAGMLALSSCAMHGRFLPHLLIASGFVVARALSKTVALRASRSLAVTGVAAVALLAFAVVRFAGSPLALGEDASWTPRGALQFATDHGLHGPVANTSDLGGYIEWSSWPSIRVLVDGRGEIVYGAEFLVRVAKAEWSASAFHAMRAQDQVSWAIASNRFAQERDAFLARDPTWAMVYWSDQAAVYVRRAAHLELANLFYRFISPDDVPASIASALDANRANPAAIDAVVAEVRRMLEASPESLRANIALLTVLDASGPSRKAERDALFETLVTLTREIPSMAAVVHALRPRS